MGNLGVRLGHKGTVSPSPSVSRVVLVYLGKGSPSVSRVVLVYLG